MHAFEFLRPSPTKRDVKPIYAVSGDDAYLRDESIRAIGRLAVGGGEGETAVSRVAGDHAKLADVLDEVRTLPFLAKCRVVVVDNADPFVTAFRKELEAYAEKPSRSGVLILSAKSWPGSTKLAKQVDKVGLAIECKTPDERDLPAWLIELAKARGKTKLDADAARLLVDLVGAEVGLLASEVDKLIVYVGDRGQIRREDVAKMVGSGRIEKIFAVVDAATTGNGRAAIEDLDHLLASGTTPGNSGWRGWTSGRPARRRGSTPTPSTGPPSNTPTSARVGSPRSPGCSWPPTSISRETRRFPPGSSSKP